MRDDKRDCVQLSAYFQTESFQERSDYINGDSGIIEREVLYYYILYIIVLTKLVVPNHKNYNCVTS